VADVPEREWTEEAESLLRTARLAGSAEPDTEEAIDFSLVHADDEFLDALGAAQPDPDGTFADDRLAALLLSWRHDVDAEPIRNLVEPKLAVATVRAARAKQRRGPRLVAPLAAAAAVLAIAFAGIGLAAQDAEPGDTLWGLARVLYADHARSVEAAQAVRSDLNRAQEALASGKVAEAKSMLDEAKHALPTVASEDGKDDLQAQHAALVAKLPDNPAVGASPPPSASPSTVPVTGTSGPSSTADTSSVNPTQTTPDPTSTTTAATTTVSPSSPGGGRVETTNNAPNTISNEGPKNDPATVPVATPAGTSGTS
jgi:hypothetical protein